MNVLRNIPSVNELLESPPLRKLVDRASRSVVVSGVRQFLENMRSELSEAASGAGVPAPSELAERIADWIAREEAPALRPVINATGILLHTGLGRAPLSEEAIAAVADVCRGYASVEIDLKSGKRSHRVAAVEPLLRQLTGAEAAAVVNNNAAATMLTLAAIASGREVIVSRGQLIEIGGSYRLPDVMSASGAQLREVGTTNKTRLSDFQSAINTATGALLRVHTSNYVVVGFTEQPSLEELVGLGNRRHLPVIDDIGSGALNDFGKYGIADEPVAAKSIRQGADLVLFSGDKLLGGPQCGIIVGRRRLVAQITAHPMMRAMRVGKMTLAALHATLRLHRDQRLAEQKTPLLALLSTSLENLQNRAERIAPQLAQTAAVEDAAAVQDHAFLGGGSVPTETIGTWVVSVKPRSDTESFAARLRAGAPSIVGRIQQDRLLLDLRSVFPSQDVQIVDAVMALQPDTQSPERVAAEAETSSDSEPPADIP